MAKSLTFTIFGDLQFRFRMNRMAHRAENMKPALKEVRDTWIEIFEDQFRTEGRRAGAPWEGLSYTTIAKRGSAHPILFDAGFLFDEMTSDSSYLVTDKTIILQADDEIQEYGGYHQSGTRIMPSRPIVDFTPIDVQRSTSILADYLFHGRLPG